VNPSRLQASARQAKLKQRSLLCPLLEMLHDLASNRVDKAVCIDRAATRVASCQDSQALEAELSSAVPAAHFMALLVLRVLTVQALLGHRHATSWALLRARFLHPLFKEFVCFALFTFVNFANIVAVYVTVAQTYHSMRLMTAGPTGFEQSKLYYLNPNIVFYRHVAIRLMLNSLWVFMLGAGCRMTIRFSEDATSGPEWVQATPEEPADAYAQPVVSRLTFLGGFICVFYCFLAVVLKFTHEKHVKVFRERYEKMSNWNEPLLQTVATVSTRGVGLPLDV